MRSELEVKKGSGVAFGTTLNRGIFPMNVPQTRFGNDLSPIRGTLNLGPGCYSNEEVSNFCYYVDKKITSEKGYSLGARTANRIPKNQTFLTPAPAHYQSTCTDAKVFKPAYKSFNSASARFPNRKRDITEATPGPGTYENNVARNCKVSWHNSFGGSPINLPSVTQQSTIGQNTEKLLSTKEEKKYNRRFAYLKLYY